MASAKRRSEKAPKVEGMYCARCGHLLAEAVTNSGQHLLLDTHVTTWVFSGRTNKESGLPIAVPSRGYIAHEDSCDTSA